METFIPQFIASGLLIAALLVAKFLINKVILKYSLSRLKSEVRMLQIKRILAILLNITFIFTFMIIWGVKPENLLFGLSSVFAIIGVAMFAQWSILSNITAGIIMFFTAPFRVGDRIRIVDKDLPVEATIENILTFYTHIRTDDNELIVLPNSLFLQKIVAMREDTDII